MQWTRIAKLSVLLTACMAAVIGFPLAHRFVVAELRSYAELPDPVVATPDETRAILAAVLAKEKFQGEPAPPPPPPTASSVSPPRPEPSELRVPEAQQVLILVDSSACFSVDPKSSDCEHISLDDLLTWPWLNSFAPLKFRQELMLANRKRHELDLHGLPSTKVVPRAEISDIFAKGGWWTDFHAKYPGSSGFAETSLPVLTADRKQALVYVAHHCGGLCGVGIVVLLERAGSGWHVVKEEELWVS